MPDDRTRHPLRVLALAATFALLPLLAACNDDGEDDDDDDDGMGVQPRPALVMIVAD